MSIRQTTEQLIRFTGVGVANSALYFFFAAALNGLFEVAAAFASAAAYLLAAAFAYLGHKYLTFRNGIATKQEISRFVTASAIGLSLALFIPVLLSDFAPIVSFITVLVVVPLVSFVIMKIFVFRS